MSFQIALSGLNAASTDLQITSNNIANANTTGFKSSRGEFADVFSGDSVGIGNGVRLTEVRQEFTQGNVDITARQLDLAISGNGFFITSDNGSLLYSRVGAFGLDATGIVQNAEGERLQIYEPVPGTGGFNQGAAERPGHRGRHRAPRGQHAGRHEHQPAGRRHAAHRRALRPERPAVLQPQHLDGPVRLARAFPTQPRTSSRGQPAGWTVNQTLDGAAVGGSEPFTFNSTGTIATPARRQHPFRTVPLTNGANALTVSLQLGDTTQFGDDFTVNSINPDGQAEGRLRGIEIDQTGIVFARFSNGQSETLGKVALANFSNPEGLQKVSDTSFQETFGSGVAQRGEATESNFGLLQSGALESSNVDLTEQLVRLITSQRLFQANAQVISTLDTLAQTIINIR